MSEDPKNPSLVYPWYVVILLMLAQTLSFIDRMILGLLVGPVRETFQISDTQFSLLAGFAFALFYAVMGLPLARIADRYSRKVLISVGMAVWSVMTVLCGGANSFAALFLARMGVGIGEASLSPAAYSMITDMFPKKLLGRAFSVYTFGVAIGSGLAYLIGGRVVAVVSNMDKVTVPVFGQMEAWQLTFFIVGIPGLILSMFFLFSVKEPERTGKITTKKSVPVKDVVQFIASKRKAILPHILGMSFFVMVVYSLNIWGPTYLMRSFGYSAPKAGLIMGLVLIIGAALGLFSGGYFGDKMYSRGHLDGFSRVILASMIGCFPFILALGFSLSPIVAIVCLFIGMYFSAFQGGIAGGVLQLMTPNEMRGQVVAFYFMGTNLLGLGFGPTILAACTDYVFKDDAAIGKSLALCGLILVPLSFVIVLYSLKHVRLAIKDMQDITS